MSQLGRVEAGVPATSPVDPPAVDAAGASPPDDTADPAPDSASSLSDELVRRAELLMLREQVQIQDRDARLDRLRSDFDYSQQQRAEFLREMNILRDMAMEQRKKDDELIKKWIALI